MNEKRKTKEQLIRELEAVRRRLSELEKPVAGMKEPEDNIKESEGLYRTLIETSPDPIILYDLNGKILAANMQTAVTYGVSTVEEFLGAVETVFDLLMDEGRTHAVANFGHTLTTGSSQKNEYQVRVRDGRCIDVEINSSVVRSATGEPQAFISVIRDITDRKRAEEMVRKSLAEKEILLKEIHHRVKNNMQVISSLLSLQAGAIRDPAVEEAFKVSQNRVKSMALIHEHLYQSENLSEIDFRQYAISLVRNIMNMYSSNRIDTRVNVDGLKLDIDRAIPCGLIINELVSNCVKHAFPDRRRGRIDVNMKELAGGGYELVVADDGVGGVEETWKCETLGMRLIRSLITQLRGSIRVESCAGTRVTIRF